MSGFIGRLFGRQKNKQRSWVHQAARGFNAAKVNRLNSDWNQTARPINQDLRTSQKVLIARARELAQNDDYVRRFLGMAKNNVIGPKGILLQARPPNRSGPGVDKPASQVIEKGWAQWGRFGNPEVTGQLSWRGIQKLFLEHLLRDGEVFVQPIPVADEGVRLKFHDPLTIPIEMNTVNSANGNRIVMGIELDDDTRAVAYYVRELKPDSQTFLINNTHVRRIPASQMLHRFIPEFVGQARGFSPMVSALSRLNMLNAFEEAAVTAARVGASQMGFVIEGEDGSGFGGDDTDDSGTPLVDVEPGTFTNLPFGSDVKKFDPNYPNVDYGQFVKAVLRGIASGLGTSYNTLANDLEGVNFSSIRAGVLEDREVWKDLQEFVIESFCQPVYADHWLLPQILAGKLTFPSNGQSLSGTRLESYRVAAWQARRWPWVDPLKDAQASELLLNQRLTSRGAIMRDQGMDPEDVWAEIQRENDILEDLGITVPTGETKTEVIEDKSDGQDTGS